MASVTKKTIWWNGPPFGSWAFVTFMSTYHTEVFRNLVLSPGLTFPEIWSLIVVAQFLSKIAIFVSKRKVESD